MTTSKRAWIYAVRMKKRTMMLILLFTVLMTISLLGITLYAASRDAAQALRGSLGGYFTLQLSGTDSGNEKTNEALLEQVRTLEGIRDCNGVDTYYLYVKDLTLIPGSYHGSGQTNEFVPRFIGCTNSSLHERFIASSYQLAEGRHITADDHDKAIISRDVADQNGLTLGDMIKGSVVEGVRGYPDYAYGTQVEYEIVGIYTVTRNEPASPQTPECDLQENVIFTDIASAKYLYSIKFPDRSPADFRYSSGIMLFLTDPARMAETVENLKQQPYADWDAYIISENNAAYLQAAAPIQKAETVSFFLLIVLLVLSIGILTLLLLLWTRERMTEIGILISLGISPGEIGLQILLETYIAAVPAYIAAVLLSIILSHALGGTLSGLMGELQFSLHPLQAVVILCCSAVVILIAVLLASISIMRKKPKHILTDLS